MQDCEHGRLAVLRCAEKSCVSSRRALRDNVLDSSDSASCASDSEWADESYLSGLADTIRWSVPCHK